MKCLYLQVGKEQICTGEKNPMNGVQKKHNIQNYNMRTHKHKKMQCHISFAMAARCSMNAYRKIRRMPKDAKRCTQNEFHTIHSLNAR